MAAIIAWVSTGFTAGDFVAWPTSFGDAVALIAGAPKDSEWTLMDWDGHHESYRGAPRGIRAATPEEIADWKARYYARFPYRRPTDK